MMVYSSPWTDGKHALPDWPLTDNLLAVNVVDTLQIMFIHGAIENNAALLCTVV